MKIRCAGVPEHFNYPWKLAIKSGDFERAGIEIEWKDESGGTGAMARDLRDNSIDLAIMLTEGAVRDIINGNPSRIYSTYVQSPLNWGVHTSAAGSITSAEHIQDFPFAISRFNSGSHLMAYVYGEKKGLKLNEDSFSLVQNLDGARQALQDNPDQLFLWEKYTTKPLVDTGEFRIIDHCLTPWPSFVVVIRDEFLQQHMEVVDTVLSIVRRHAEEFTNSEDPAREISDNYGIVYEDAALWLDSVEWKVDFHLDINMLKGVGQVLYELGILSHIPSGEEIKDKLLFPLAVEM